MTDLVGKLANPYAAFEATITWADAHQCVTHMQATSQSLVSGFMNLRQHREAAGAPSARRKPQP